MGKGVKFRKCEEGMRCSLFGINDGVGSVNVVGFLSFFWSGFSNARYAVDIILLVYNSVTVLTGTMKFFEGTFENGVFPAALWTSHIYKCFFNHVEPFSAKKRSVKIKH
jgi:hypothetical protein